MQLQIANWAWWSLKLRFLAPYISLLLLQLHSIAPWGRLNLPEARHDFSRGIPRPMCTHSCTLYMYIYIIDTTALYVLQYIHIHSVKLLVDARLLYLHSSRGITCNAHSTGSTVVILSVAPLCSLSPTILLLANNLALCTKYYKT